jgi:hypothetical protein
MILVLIYWILPEENRKYPPLNRTLPLRKMFRKMTSPTLTLPPVEVDPPEIDVNDPDNDPGRDPDTGDYDVPAPDSFDNDDDAD